MISYTLSYNGGAYKALADWGICADFSLNFQSKGKDELRLRTVEGMADTLQWEFDNPVILKDGAGVVLFKGTVGAIARVGDNGRENAEYSIYNVWYLMERLVFKQTRNMFAGWTIVGRPDTPPTFVQVFTSEVYVGEKADATYQTNGQQVVEILDWVNRCWNPTWKTNTAPTDVTQNVVQYPALTNYPSVNIPKSRINDVFCSEACVNVLRYSPDRAVSWDYTTSPPTLKLVPLGIATEITVSITADQERQLKTSPQFERQLNGVMIHYKRTDTIDGSVAPQVFVDKYPLSIDDFTTDCSTHTIDLVGNSVTHVKADIQVKPLADALGFDADLRKAWWKVFCPELSAPGVDDGVTMVIDQATVDGSPDLSVYKNVLLPHSGLADWLTALGIVAQEATVRASATFNRYTDTTKKVKSAKHAPKELHVRVVLTNAVTNIYLGVQHAESAEATPVGVAQAVYNSVKDLQHAGTITLVGDQSQPAGQRDGVRTDIKPGVKLKLVGPTETFSNCLVQSAVLEPHFGRVQVTFGPSALLDVQERIELQRVGRFRLTYNMPSGRANGSLSGGASVSLSDQTPKENTTMQLVSDSLQAATADLGGGFHGVVVKEANQTVTPVGNVIPANPVLQVHQVVSSTGLRDDSKGAFDFRLIDTIGSDGLKHIIRVVEVDICVAGTPKKILLMGCDPF